MNGSAAAASNRKRKYASAEERLAAALRHIDGVRMPCADSGAYERQRAQVCTSLRVARMLSRRAAVEAHMRGFAEHARERTWPSADLYVADLLREWYRALETHCTLYERAQDASLCTELCAGADSSIVQLCAAERVYGCTEHSTVHVCDRRTCEARIVTPSHSVVCLFSGVAVGTMLGGYDSVNRQFERSGAHGGMARRVDAARAAAVGVLEQRGGEAASVVARIRREEHARDAGNRKTAPPTLYVRRGQRLASARQQYKLQRRVGAAHREAQLRLVAVAERVIDELLFDREAREMINAIKLDEARTTAVRALRAYHGACRAADSVPNSVREAEVYATPFGRLRFLPLVERSEKRRTAFVRLAVALWRVCHTSPYAARVRSAGAAEQSEAASGRRPAQTKHWMRQTTCTYVQFCAALLYASARGLFRDAGGNELERLMRPSLVFVPCDRRLAVELPPEEDIDAFGRESLALIRAHLHRDAASVEATAATDAAAAAAAAAGDCSRRRQTTRTTEIAGALFKSDGTRNKRKKRRRKRSTLVASGRGSIDVRSAALDAPGLVRARECDTLPTHLHSDIVGELSSYEKCDLSRGRSFLQLCVNSLDTNVAERESRAIFADE